MAEIEQSGNPEGAAAAAADAARSVFISYASQDVVVANKVCSALEAAGLPCWIAPRDVQAGAPYGAAIVEAINACRLLVLVLSKSAIGSPHVLREVERASSKKRPVLSIRMDATELPPDLEYFLSANHWLDASGGPIERILPALVEAVRGRASAARSVQPTVHHPVTRPPGRLNRTVIVLAAVIGIGLAAFVAQRFWLKKPGPAASEDIASGAATGGISPKDKSIAVLPFTDMSEKHDQEYFSDGMAEEIIDLLVKVPQLKVPARTSSFYFKGKSTQVPEIARQLGVANVLEGSVRKSGDHLRVTAQLVRADNGFHLWSETYDRQLDDVFKTQDEIAGAVVKALKVSLLEGEAPSATLTTNSEAYELYLQARALSNQGNSGDTLKAYADLKRAVSLDPKFALAWASLAGILSRDNVHWDRVFSHVDSSSQSDAHALDDWASIWAQARAEAHAAADKAIQLGPDLGETHAAMSQVLAWLDWDWTAADLQLKQARELEPGNARIILAAAEMATDLGHVSEGLELAHRATVLDPLGNVWDTIGFAQYCDGALDEARASRHRQLELYPSASYGHYAYAQLLLAQGDPNAALSEFERESLSEFRDVGPPLALDALGRHAEADRAIAIAEQKDGNAMAYQISYIYAARHDPDRAFSWLERAYRQHDGGLALLKVDPMLKSLHQDPRYKDLLHKMRLPE